MNSSNDRKECTKARARSRVTTREEKQRAPAREGQGNSFPSPNIAQTRATQALAMQIMKTEKLTNCSLTNGDLIDEHNMSLGLISVVLLFTCLSGMETCIVVRIVDEYSLLLR